MFIKPFLKWAGGKYRLLHRILPALPEGKRLVEPFAGSGAVFINSPFSQMHICDLNPDLIGLFTTLQAEQQAFIAYCQTLFTGGNSPELYADRRQQFNCETDKIERAALFLYLNRHAYNGLIRYNRAGEYNVPFGRYKKPYFPEKELLFFVERCARTEITFAVQDFRTTFADLRPGDVVYADPPYVPLSETANFTSYAGNAFQFTEQEALAAEARAAADRQIPVVISNHDTNFTRKLYAGAHIESFEVRRLISCKGTARTKAQEILALFTGPEVNTKKHYRIMKKGPGTAEPACLKQDGKDTDLKLN